MAINNYEDDFINNVKEFCLWLETEADPEKYELIKLRKLLIKIYLSALNLPSYDNDIVNEISKNIGLSLEDINKRIKWCANIKYKELLEPLNMEKEEIFDCSTSVDIFDLYSDLKHFLLILDSEDRTQSISDIRSSFLDHWGIHLLSAIKIFHLYENKYPNGLQFL